MSEFVSDINYQVLKLEGEKENQHHCENKENLSNYTSGKRV